MESVCMFLIIWCASFCLLLYINAIAAMDAAISKKEEADNMLKYAKSYRLKFKLPAGKNMRINPKVKQLHRKPTWEYKY